MVCSIFCSTVLPNTALDIVPSSFTIGTPYGLAMAIEVPQPASLPAANGTSAKRSPPELVSTLKPIYAKFLKDLKATDCIQFENEKLLKAVMEHAHSTGLVIEPGTLSYQTLMVGYSMADVGTPNLVQEVEIFTGPFLSYWRL